MWSLKKYKIFLKKRFESKGFYISYKWMKPKKKKERTEIVFIKTEKYVIPEPSPEAFEKEQKPKYKFFNTNQQELYEKFDIVLDPYFKSIALVFYHKTVYSTGPLKNFTKFSFTIKFDFLRIMSHILSFYNFSSFGMFYVKLFFSENKFKLLNKIIFWEFFTPFINHNKPFVWKKGKKYIGKQQGTALILIWWAIFWQIIYENMNLPFQFTQTEMKNFWLAEVDIYDNNYYWPTRWLNLLGLSTHSGKKSESHQFIENNTLIWFKYFKSILEKNFWFKILKQIFFWKEIFIKLIIDDWLFFDVEDLIYTPHIETKFKMMPISFFGKKNLFFTKNYLYNSNTELSSTLEQVITYSHDHNIYKILSFHSSFYSFNSLLSQKRNNNKFGKINGEINLFRQKKIISKKIISKFLITLQREIITLKDLTPIFFESCLSLNNLSELHLLPEFLVILFFLLSSELVDKNLLEKFIILPLLNNFFDTKQLENAYLYNDIYNKKLNLFWTKIFKNFKFEKFPTKKHKFFYENLLIFLQTDFNSKMDHYTSDLKFFNTIYLLEKNNFFEKTKINLAITPASLLSLKYSFLIKKNNEFLKIKKKYNVVVILNIFFFVFKILWQNRIPFVFQWFIYNFFYLCINTKNKYKKFKFRFSNNWYINWINFSFIKPREFHFLEKSEDYINWFINFLDPFAKKVDTKELSIDLNFCLPKTIILTNEKYFLTKLENNKITTKKQLQNIEKIWFLYLKWLQKKLYKNFLIRLLTPWFWLTIFFKNINLTKIAKLNFQKFNLYRNINLVYSNVNLYKTYNFYFDKFWVFWIIEMYFIINNIFLNQRNILSVRIKKLWQKLI